MNTSISFADLQLNPLLLTETVSLKDGRQVTIRPLSSPDNLILGSYFLGLSEKTKSLYGPHPFDQPTADRWCEEINYSHTIRFIALLNEPPAPERVIGYFILEMGVPGRELERYTQAGITLDPQVDCLVAPSIADEFQSQGLGSLMMGCVFRFALKIGRRRVVLMGGVYVSNERAVHFYQKMGFCMVGAFDPPWPNGSLSYDMYKDLTS